MKLRCLLFLSLFIQGACLESLAQNATLEGTVMGRDGLALTGASIMVRGSVLGAVTDHDGAFVIRRIAPGKRVLSISMLGYARMDTTLLVMAGQTMNVHFILEPTSLLTDEVVVTAGRHAQSLESVPVSVAVLSSQAIGERTLISLDQALRLMPGVTMTESQVNIRGSSGYSRGIGSRVLLLVDGIPQLAADASDMKFDAIPVFAVDRVEVVKGSGSALYGSSALGGVINVLTKDPQDRQLRMRAYSGLYDSPYHDAWKWWGSSPRFFHGMDAQYADRNEQVSWLVTGGVRSNQAYRQNDDFLRWNLFGKLGWKPTPEKNVQFSASYSDDLRGNWVYWKSVNEALIPPPATDLSETVQSTKFQAAGQITSTLSNDFAYALRGYLYRTANDVSSDSSDFSTRPFDRTQATAVVYGVEAQGSYSLMPGNLLIAGVDLQTNSVASSTYGDRTAYNVAVYAQHEWNVGTPSEGSGRTSAPITVSTGIRMDAALVDTLGSETRLNPRLGIAWSPAQGTTFRGSYGWGFRAPSIAERFVTASAGGLQTKPNPNLKAERSTSYELGLRQILSDLLVFDVALFWNDYTNIIEPTLDLDGRIVFRNITEARIRGVEFGVQSSMFDRMVDFSAGYTVMYPLDLTLHRILRYRSRHVVQSSVSFNWMQFRLGVDYRFISRIEEIDDAIRLVIKDADQRVDAHVTDVRLGYSFRALFHLPLSAVFSVNNVFQYNYSEMIGNIAPIRHFTFTLEMEL